ncbi:MAG: acyl carrier protein [Fischerella sp. CENA71]|nr:acyl carrier protein [Fischerella sp. CENA71]
MAIVNKISSKIVQTSHYSNSANTLSKSNSQKQRLSFINCPSQESLKAYLILYLSNYLQISYQELDVNLPFHYYGMNLVDQLSLTSMLEDYLGYCIPNDIVCKYPTIEKLAEYLVEGVSVRVKHNSCSLITFKNCLI